MFRKSIKRFLFAIAFVAALPLILAAWLEAALISRSSERCYDFGKELAASVPTIIGQYLRLAYYKAVCTKIDFDTCFSYGSMVAHRDTVIGSGTVIGAYTIIGFADIGENVLLGARISIISGKYQHGRPDERSGDLEVTEEFSRIQIGANSWIGEGALILANIGVNCTIGAGSVLFKEAPDNTTFMGNPARKVSMN